MVFISTHAQFPLWDAVWCVQVGGSARDSGKFKPVHCGLAVGYQTNLAG